MASYPSGKGTVCKTVIEQFDSVRRLYKDGTFSIVLFFRIRHGKAGIRLYIGRLSYVQAAFFLTACNYFFVCLC